MKNDTSKKNARATGEQPRTPADHSTRSAKSVKAATTNRKKRMTSPHAVTAASSLKVRKTRSVTDSQTTLTQLFGRPIAPAWDPQLLDCFEDGKQGGAMKTTKAIDLAGDSSDGRSHCPTSSRRALPVGNPRTPRAVLQDDHDSPSGIKDRKPIPSSSSLRRGKHSGVDSSVKRRNGRGTSKKAGLGSSKRRTKTVSDNQTLTQMNYVRPFVVIESDDDQGLDYIGEGSVAGGLVDDDTIDDQCLSRRKRRKLSTEIEESIDPSAEYRFDEVTGNLQPHRPATPQKPQKLEIPSSQSPESPGCVIISPSLFRNNDRNLSEKKSRETADCPKKEEIRDSYFTQRSSQKPMCMLPLKSESSPRTGVWAASEASFYHGKTASDSLVQSEETALECDGSIQRTTPSNFTDRPAPDDTEPNPPLKFDKAVVYETDAESDYGPYGDYDDNLSQGPGSNYIGSTVNDDGGGNGDDDDDDVEGDDSLDLPSIPNSGTDLDGSDVNNEELTLPSDASENYHRPSLYTQFPTEPIPALDTQKLEELFPRHSNVEESRIRAPALDRPPTSKNSTSQLQTLTQTQTQSQDPAELSTEVAPESSPLLSAKEAVKRASRGGSHAQESVVLVESSQLVDKINNPYDLGEDRPQGIVQASQWLTDSVMESIPLPPMWMPINGDKAGGLEMLPDKYS